MSHPGETLLIRVPGREPETAQNVEVMFLPVTAFRVWQALRSAAQGSPPTRAGA